MPDLTDSMNDATDAIVEKSVFTTESLIDKAKREMRKLSRETGRTASVGMFDGIIRRLGVSLKSLLTTATIGGIIAGAGEALTDIDAKPKALIPDIPDDFQPPPEAPDTVTEIMGERPEIRFPVVEQAVKKLDKSPVLAGRDFRQTAEAVRGGAFAVTADITDEQVALVRQTVSDAINKGSDQKEFLDDVTGTLDEGVGISPGRMQGIFRTNVGQALSDSMEVALESPFVEDAFPYRQYIATNDNRVRIEHLSLEDKTRLPGSAYGLNGTAVYWKGDPVWGEFRPPWNFGCRCAWSPATVLQAKRAGVKEAKDWWNRAKKLADELGGPVQAYLEETEPFPHETVDHPPFSAPPEFRRDAVTA